MPSSNATYTNELHTRSGYWYSVAIHVSVAVCMATFAFVGEVFKKPPEQPLIFQMQEPVPNAPLIPKEEQTTPSEAQVKLPEFEQLKPLNIKQPEPEEVAEPEPAPTPKPVKKITKPKPQKKVSYAEWAKKNKKNSKPKKTTTSHRAQNVKIDKISASTTNLNALAKAKISNVAGASSAMKDALGAYVQYINRVAKANWVFPDELAGMQISCEIIFKVSQTGSISGLRVLRSSGDRAFDDSVMRALRSIRLREPPDALSHMVTLTFTTQK